MSKTLLRSTTLVSVTTSISRVMGFARDMLTAHLFGVTSTIDAFYVAFRIPNFMRGLFAEGAFAQAFVPVLSEYRQLKTPEESHRFIAHTQGGLMATLLVIVFLGLIFTSGLTTVFAPGYLKDPQQFSLATELLRITFPYLLLISLTAFYSSILNAYGYFGIASFTPVILNTVMIIAAILGSLYFHPPVLGLAWGVLIAGILQFLFQLPFLKRHGLLILPKLAWRDEGMRRVLKLLVPALFASSVAQISLLIDTIFASFLVAGSVTWLYYSDRLIYFPLGIFGVALATVVLPHLSRKHADRSANEFSQALDWALRCVFIIAVPSAVGLFMLATPLFSSLFQYGKFSAHDVSMSAYSLKAYAFGLPAFMLVKVLASGFYSKQNIKTPVKIAIIALSVNMILNFILIYPLAHAGLALATALSSSLNAILLCISLLRLQSFQLQAGWIKYLLQLLCASGIMAGLLFVITPDPLWWIQADWKQRIFQLSYLLITAIICYFMSLWVFGVRLRHFRGKG